MKKILNVLIVALGVSMLFASCKKEVLETAPAGALSGAEIFGDSQKAQSAVDGIYRMMYSNGWSASWAHENPGLATFTIVRSLMGEDHLCTRKDRDGSILTIVSIRLLTGQIQVAASMQHGICSIRSYPRPIM